MKKKVLLLGVWIISFLVVLFVAPPKTPSLPSFSSNTSVSVSQTQSKVVNGCAAGAVLAVAARKNATVGCVLGAIK